MFTAVNNLKEQKGFTLIELLIVIAIIGILAAIAIPAFLGQREKAKIRGVEAGARGAMAEAQSMLDAFVAKEPFLISAAGGGEECIEYTAAATGKNCDDVYGQGSDDTYTTDIGDIKDDIVRHYGNKEDKSPFNAANDLFIAGIKGTGSVGQVVISNTTANALTLQGFGGTVTAMIFNSTVSAR